MTKRTLIPVEHLSKGGQKLFDVMYSEGDLSTILVAASYLDATLGSILKRKLIKSSVSKKLLNIQGGAIGTFSTRADMCYILELINKPLYQDLITILKIRNEVAHHHLELDFKHKEVETLCNELSYVTTLKNGNSDEPLINEEWLDGARNQFTISVTLISQRLLLTGLGLTPNEKPV